MSTKALSIAACGGLLLALGGCAESRLRLNPDFGEAVHQNTLAQTADPDAHYAGNPAPASNGPRTAAAQDRYVTGHVTPPASTSTSSVSAGGGGSSGPQ
jgi:hypothetical protein